MAKYKIALNDSGNIREILQQAYDLSEEMIVQADKEIAKLSNATQLQNEPMDAKAKYAKAINDYIGMKDKAVAKKLEIAKLMKEIFIASGKGSAKLQDTETSGKQTLDFDKIKQMVTQTYEETNKKKTIRF